MDSPPRGTLYLVPAPLDFGCATQAPLTDVMPAAALMVPAGSTSASGATASQPKSSGVGTR